MGKKAPTVTLLLGIAVVLCVVDCQRPNTWKAPSNRARERTKLFDFSRLFMNRQPLQTKPSTFPAPPAPLGQPASSVPAHFFPPHMQEPPESGPNDAFNYQQHPWAMQPYMQQSRQSRVPPPPPQAPSGAASPSPPPAPVAPPQPVAPKRMNPFQLMTHTGPGGFVMCRPTPAMPRLCDINGESNLNYRLMDVIKAIPSMKKVPQCYRNIPRVQCNSYHAAQYIWREGFCYCKYYKNNAHLYGGQQLECILNDCGACTQEFYVGNQRLICD
ncbi:methionine-rich protein-like isoform X2 [Gigantopelta aegis]|uniref:methionine-rich protein-like isoform X2 n=1 Tax=Gigantopelta aegis TaxID=1735272 RepID=UPI001B88D9A8|nr:methionine-rich protein-like isoform X2 [Gigantopelta aegis]